MSNWKSVIDEGMANNTRKRDYSFTATIPLAALTTGKIALRPEVEQEDENFKALQESISVQGIRQPIQVIQHGDNPHSFMVIDGLHRYTAATNLKLDNVPVIVTPNLSDTDIVVEQFVANNSRIETKPVQYAKHLRRYLAAFPDTSIAELANVFKTSRSRVDQLLKISRDVHPEIQPLIDAGQLTLTNALALARIPEDLQHQYLEDAKNKTFDVFGPQMLVESEKIKKARRTSNASETGDEFTPVATLRKKPELLTYHNELMGKLKELTGITDDEALGNDIQSNYENRDASVEVMTGILLGIRYALRLDIESVTAQRNEAEAKAAERALKQAEKDREKIAAQAAKGSASSKILGL